MLGRLNQLFVSKTCYCFLVGTEASPAAERKGTKRLLHCPVSTGTRQSRWLCTADGFAVCVRALRTSGISAAPFQSGPYKAIPTVSLERLGSQAAHARWHEGSRPSCRSY